MDEFSVTVDTTPTTSTCQLCVSGQGQCLCVQAGPVSVCALSHRDGGRCVGAVDFFLSPVFQVLVPKLGSDCILRFTRLRPWGWAMTEARL